MNLANEWNIPYMETSAKNSTVVNNLFTEIVKEMNFKLSKGNGHTRKEKKKMKKLTNLSINSNVNNKTSSSSDSNSFSSNNTKESAKMKLKKANYDKRMSNCDFFQDCCTACFCCCYRDSSTSYLPPDVNYYSKGSKSKCSIL